MKDKQKEIESIAAILSQSDIVWGRYGSDTIEALAKRIWNNLNEKTD